MANKQSENDQLSSEQLLEKRVDAMMDSKANEQTAPTSGPAISSAPPLPGKRMSTQVSVVSDPTEELVQTPIKSEQVAVKSPEAPVDSQVKVEPANIDTPESDAAIDDIVAQEADTVLAAADAGIAIAQDDAETIEPPKKHGHPVFWFGVVFIAILAIITAVVLVNPDLLP